MRIMKSLRLQKSGESRMYVFKDPHYFGGLKNYIPFTGKKKKKNKRFATLEHQRTSILPSQLLRRNCSYLSFPNKEFSDTILN